jgi:hypothetical protein
MTTLGDLMKETTGGSGGLSYEDMPTSSIGAGWGAGLANWQAGLGALGGALGMDNEDFINRKTAEAEFYQRNSPGATQFFGDEGVAGDGKLTDWLAYNFGQSAPYVLEMLVGGVGGGLARGAAAGAVKQFGGKAVAESAARSLAGKEVTAAMEREALEQAAKAVGTRYAAGAGGVAASYPSAVGDILLNQREAGGENLGAAMAGGIPYALLNLLGGEGAVLKAATSGMGGRAGLLGAAKNIGEGAVKSGVMEGVGETGQEVINQSFGRMAIDPTEGLLSGDAPMRYAESFMAGLGLGGPMGGAAHAFAKPQIGTPDEIASRVDVLQRSMDYLERGIGTDLDVLEQGRENEKRFAEEQKKAAEKRAKEQDALRAKTRSKTAAERITSLGEDIATAAPVTGEVSPLSDMIETLAIENMVAKDEAAKADAVAKEAELSTLMGVLSRQQDAQRAQQTALLSGAQPDMFPNAQLQGPSTLPTPYQFDEQDRFRAQLTNMQVAPLVAQTPTPDLSFEALARLAEDLTKVTAQPEPLVSATKFASPEGMRAVTPAQEMKSRGTPATADLGLAQGTREEAPLVTEGGQLRAKFRPVQPMALEDLAKDLTARIDNAVAVQEITPEVGTQLKDEVAGQRTPSYDNLKAVRTKFEAARTAPVVPTVQETQNESAAVEEVAEAEAPILSPEAIADLQASAKAQKKADRAKARFEKLDNSLAVDDPKVEKARAAKKLAEAEAEIASQKANAHFEPKERKPRAAKAPETVESKPPAPQKRAAVPIPPEGVDDAGQATEQAAAPEKTEALPNPLAKYVPESLPVDEAAVTGVLNDIINDEKINTKGNVYSMAEGFLDDIVALDGDDRAEEVAAAHNWLTTTVAKHQTKKGPVRKVVSAPAGTPQAEQAKQAPPPGVAAQLGVPAKGLWPGEHFEYTDPMRGEPAELTEAKRKVVDYMNGDIDRADMTQAMIDSKLPQGTIRAITNRLGEHSFSNGEIDAILAAEPAAPTVIEVDDTPVQTTLDAAAVTRLLTPEQKKAVKDYYGGKQAAAITSLADDYARWKKDSEMFIGHPMRPILESIRERASGFSASKTIPNTPEERTTVQKIKAALRSWFLSPEQASSRLVVVQKWEDLSQAIRDRVAEAQKSVDYPGGKIVGDFDVSVTHGVGKSRITKMVPVLKNPTKERMLAMSARALKLLDSGELRIFSDNLGNTYAWPAFETTHMNMAEALGYPDGVESYGGHKLLGRKALEMMEAPEGELAYSKELSRIQAFVLDGKGYMIADNISAGNEMAVFMHEIGAHIGLDGQETQIMERVNLWRTSPEGSVEKQVFDAMQARMDAAGETSQTEQVAYAVEEAVKAGVTPKAVARGMKVSDIRTVQDLVDVLAKVLKAAVDKVFKTNTRGFNAQQLVDLAYGAARDAMQDQTVGADVTAMSKEGPQFSIAATLPDQVQRFVGPSGVQIWDGMKALVRRVVLETAYLPALVSRFEGRIPALRTMYDAMLAAETRKIALDQDVDGLLNTIIDAKLSRQEVKDLNTFLMDSTTEGKWGYDPKFKRETTVDPEFERRFKALPPKMQEIVKGVFQHGETAMQDKRAVFEKLGIADPFKRLTQLQGPYAPLRRFGNFMVEVKSAALVAEEAKQRIAEGGFKDTTKIDELKSDPDNYRISFRPTMSSAQMLYNELMATGNYVRDRKNSYVGPRADAPYMPTEITRGALAKVRESVRGNDALSRDIKSKMESTINDLYHQMMEDHLARQSMRQRKYRAGADEDMLAAFAMQARAEASFIANMEHAQEINAATYQVSNDKETGAKEQRLQDVVNMMLNHRKRMLEYEATPYQDFAVGGTSAMQLATSPGYHIANATQVSMKTVPAMAAEFNDYMGAWRHVNNGYKFWAKIKGQVQGYDWSHLPEGGLRTMFETAARMNLIEVGMAEDSDQFNPLRSGYAAVDEAAKKGRLVIHKLRQVSRAVERANRVTTGYAAFNMAKEHGRTDAEAQAFAIRMLEETQGDFSHLASPMIIKRLPKFITQYRKYQLMVAALYAKAFYDSFKGSSPAEKAIARRMLGYMLVHTSMVGGLLGLPLMNLAEIIIPSLFGDEDEPKDLERMLRDWFGPDSAAADIVLKGPISAMLGIDLGAKLSDDRVFSILPYTDVEVSREGFAKGLVGLLGPGMAQATKMIDGLSLMSEGQMAQGVEKLLDKGTGDALKAYRIANEGLTLRNGDVLVKPEDISVYQSILQGLGMPAGQMKRYQWLRGQQVEITQFYKDRELEIKRDYIKAVRGGNDTTEMKDRWISLQEGKAKMRVYFGNSVTELKSKPLKPLIDAPKNQQKREQKRQDTITTD